MENSKNFMTEEDVDLFIDTVGFFLDYYNLPNYHISYFGGEPLLNWKIIKYSLPKFKQDKRCGSIVLITNGLLLDDDKYNFITTNGCGLSLSFDGLWNEYNRPLEDGTSSLELYKEKKWLFEKTRGCKVMVSPTSLGTMVKNFKFLVDDMGIYNPDYSLVRDDIWSKEDIEKFKVEVEELANVFIEYIEKGVRCSIGFFILPIADIIVGKKFGKRPFGCFAGCKGIGYFPGGMYYPCARFGSYKKFPLYDAKENKPYMDNLDFLKKPEISDPRTYEKCKKCHLYNFCNAGCTYSQMEQFNFEKCGPVDSVCQLYYILYDVSYRIYNKLKTNRLYTQIIESFMNNCG
jgi:uncharacterized protein